MKPELFNHVVLSLTQVENARVTQALPFSDVLHFTIVLGRISEFYFSYLLLEMLQLKNKGFKELLLAVGATSFFIK